MLFSAYDAGRENRYNKNSIMAKGPERETVRQDLTAKEMAAEMVFVCFCSV